MVKMIRAPQPTNNALTAKDTLIKSANKLWSIVRHTDTPNPDPYLSGRVREFQKAYNRVYRDKIHKLPEDGKYHRKTIEALKSFIDSVTTEREPYHPIEIKSVNSNPKIEEVSVSEELKNTDCLVDLISLEEEVTIKKEE